MDMTNALKIAKLDFLVIKSQLILSALSLLFMVILTAVAGFPFSAFALQASLLSVVVIGGEIFAIQENTLERLYGSVSVNTEDIVRGRYISALLLYALSFVSVIAVYIFILLFKNNFVVLVDVLSGFNLSFLFFSITTGFQMPLLFKLGFSKSRGWAIIPFFLPIPLLFFLLVPYLAPLSPAFLDINEFIISNQMILFICGLSLSCVILYLSYRASVVFYRGRKRG